MSTPLRILAFVPTLGGGGAEKHVERIANAVDRTVARIDVAVVRTGGGYERFLDRDVATIDLGSARIRSSTAGLAASFPKLRQAMASGRWDAVIAFLERPALVALAAHASLPVSRRPALLLSVQADPRSVIAEDPAGRVIEAAMRHVYRRADGLLAISEGVADALRSFDRSLSPVVVPNACLDEGRAPIARPRIPRSIVACGRFVPQKGFDVLVDAFASVRARVPDATLTILGTGPDEASIRERIARLGLVDAVNLPGFMDDPLPEFAAADVFCLSSRFEGLGMVIVEAMSVGTPVLATDCPHGPREILDGGRFGRLVPREDAPALADGLVALLLDDEARTRFAALGRERAEDYRSTRVAAGYVDAVRDVAGRVAARRSKSRS